MRDFEFTASSRDVPKDNYQKMIFQTLSRFPFLLILSRVLIFTFGEMKETQYRAAVSFKIHYNGPDTN